MLNIIEVEGWVTGSTEREISQEGRRAPADVVIGEFDRDHDEVFDGGPECDDR